MDTFQAYAAAPPRAPPSTPQTYALVGLLSLVKSFRTTPSETVRADFPHTACGRALAPAVLGCFRIEDGALEAMQSEVPEVASSPGFRRRARLASSCRDLARVRDVRGTSARLARHPHCKDDDRRGGDGERVSFDFLGYTFQPRRAKNRWGHYFVSFLPASAPRLPNRAGKPFANGGWHRPGTTNNWKIGDRAPAATSTNGGTANAEPVLADRDRAGDARGAGPAGRDPRRDRSARATRWQRRRTAGACARA